MTRVCRGSTWSWNCRGLPDHVQLFWCSLTRSNVFTKERERKKKKVTRLYTCTRRGGKGKGEFEKEGGKLVRAGGGQRSDGRKVVENKVIIFFSGRRRAISWTRTRGIDGCFRRSESWREKRLTDEYLKFWRGTSEPDAHELRMNFHPLCCLVSSRVTWLRQAWEREREDVFFFFLPPCLLSFEKASELRLSRKVICSVHMRREAENETAPRAAAS